MTLLFADGFEDGTTPWTLTNGAVGTGRAGSGFVASTSGGKALLGITSTAGPLIAGCAVNVPTAAAMNVLTFGETNNEHVQIQRGAAGEINAYRANNLLGSSAAGVLPAAAWSYVECKMTVSATTGIVVVRVNGIQVLNLTNVNTKDGLATTATYVSIGGSPNFTGQTGAAYDDFYLCDATGSYNNDFVGDIVVEHLRPVADDGVAWLGSDGNSTDNYALVDEAGTFNGADYVASATVGQRDLYTVSSSSKSTATPVAGVVLVAVAMKTDTGARGVKLDIKEGSGGTVRSSAELGLPTTFGEIRVAYDRKADGTAWTVADANVLRIGYEVST